MKGAVPMIINEIMRQTIADEGRTQKWTCEEMNRINPELKMNAAKFSAIMTGRRKVTGEEMIAFCKALRKNPEIFTRISA